MSLLARWSARLASWMVDHRVEILAMFAGAALATLVLLVLLR